jgi:hypothetical protein
MAALGLSIWRNLSILRAALMGCGYFVRLFVSLVRIVFIAAIFNFIHSMSVWNCRQRQQPEHDFTGHCLSIEAPLRLFAFFYPRNISGIIE